MTKLFAIYLLFLAFLTLGIMLYQQITGKHRLLTIRNFALIGFVVFQLTGGIAPLWTTQDGRYNINWVPTGFQYVFMSTLFLLVFFPAYHWGIGAKRLAKWTPTSSVVPGTATMLWLAALFTIMAIVLRLSVNIPYVSMIAGRMGIGFAAVAVGFASWVWIRSMWNPVFFLWFAGILCANLALVLSQSFGRRNLIAIGAAMMWGMYYSKLRFMNPRALIIRVVIVSLPPLFLVAAFTSVRDSGDQRVSLGQQLKNITTQSNVSHGLLALAGGQDCARVSLWCIENFPERFEYDHLLAVKYFFYLPVPRAIWQDKPLPLGVRQPKLANLKGVNLDELTTGPGVIGHAAAEGGYYALIVYAIIGALFLRYFDEIVTRNTVNPLVVLPVGASLGQMVGFARGDLSLFAAAYILAVVGVYITTITLAKLLELIRGPDAEAVLAADVADWEQSQEYATDYDEWDNWDSQSEADHYSEHQA